MKIVCKVPELMEDKGIDKKTLAEAAKLHPKTLTDYCRSQVKRYSEESLEKLYQYFELTSLSELIEFKR